MKVDGSYRAAPSGLGIILMQTGLLILAVWPVAVSRPEAGSMRNTTIELESWFSASRKDPVGSIAKLRGVLPRVGSWPTAVSLPDVGSIAKIAMLSCPRFDPYRNLPEGWTWTSAVEPPRGAS